MAAAEPAPGVGDPAFWEGCHREGRDRWELGGPTPPLAEYLGRRVLPQGRVAVPGCGRGHDARLLARHGHRVWGFDFAHDAIAGARALAAAEGLPVTFEQRDVFILDRAYAGAFDGVWEYTCFCAIDPARRPEYVEVVSRILRPGGWLLACFFPVREGSGGPPFPTTRAEVERLFAPRFALLEHYVPESSAEGRRGLEWMVRMRRSAATAPA
jgi:SAM-dependent methyltransferase